jgi:DNA polymerase
MRYSGINNNYRVNFVMPDIFNGGAMVIARMDFETYSEAGYVWNESAQLWKPLQATKPGIKAVGAAAYSEHPSTEALCVAYDLADGRGGQLWINTGSWLAGSYGRVYFPPMDLFEYVVAGGLIEAHNSLFEYFMWKNVCEKKYRWPALRLDQMRCSAARVRSVSIPGDLKTAAIVLKARHLKIEDGGRLIQKFSCPKKPTKKDPRRRILPENDPTDAANMYRYCVGDIEAEADISALTPDLLPQELKLWQLDQKINARGVYIDRPLLDASIGAIESITEKYTAELTGITGGAVDSAGKLQKMAEWLRGRGLNVDTLQSADVEEMLGNDAIKGDSRRVIEIRSLLGLSSVKKLYAIRNMLCKDGRLRDLFMFYGALHTGRWTGKGVQPQNLPGSAENMEEIITDILKYDLLLLEKKYSSPIEAISNCLRGLFCAAPGKKLICSDFKAIEAVVLACLAGEQWRIDVFKGHGLIYEICASKITGVPLEEFIRVKKETGEHHKHRKIYGKIPELASGYQGWIGAWKKFGADKFLTDEEIKRAILKWRADSPNIVKFWAAMQNHFIDAVLNPGKCTEYRGIGFGVRDNTLYIRLPSGRFLRYHEPRADFMGYDQWTNEPIYKLSYMGKNNNPLRGGMGWIRLETYGGCLTENIVQAVSRDFLANALLNLDAAGYDTVLHIHDEPVAEVPAAYGNVSEFEACMTTLPTWAAGWPIKAGGGWEGKRYHK